MAETDMNTAAEARDGTIELVSAFVSNSNNRLTGEELQSLIRETFATLSSLSGPVAAPAEPVDDLTKTKAEIKRAISDDGIVSFIDGKKYQSLKRHLGRHDMTPESYRATYGLPNDFPMVAPAYSARRSELAKAIGLGSKGRQAKAAAPVAKPKATRKPKAAVPAAE